MTRSIKFRAWDKKHRRWCWDINFGGKLPILELEPERDDPNEIIIEQFIGLKDKQDKEIYEGDIVEHRYSDGSGKATNWEIAWTNENHDGVWTYHPIRRHEDFVEANNHYYAGWNPGDFTVIGNVHENPELLK